MGNTFGIHASKLSRDVLRGGLYAVQGTDNFWENRTENVFRSLLPPDSLSLRIIEQVTDIYEIISAFGTMSFSDDKTVVLVRDNETKLDAKAHKILEEFLNTPIAPDYLVFCGSSFLNNAELKKCQIISCAPLDRFDCVNYCQQLFPNGIEREGLQSLTALCGYDMSKIGNEATKLNAYRPDGKITLKDVENLVTEDIEVSVFNFVGNIVEGKNALAQKQLDKLLKQGEKPAVLLALLANQFRRMLLCAVTPEDDAEMANILGIKEFAVKKTRSITGYSQAKLKSCLTLLTDCEYKFKSGILSDETAFKIVTSKLLCKEVI